MLGPNITGRIGITGAKEYGGATASGAFRKYSYGTVNNAIAGTGNCVGFNFDASLTSTIYKDTQTVQPNANQLLIIIKA